MGIKNESINKIRFAPGVIGKSSIVALAALAVVGVAASRISNEYFLLAIAIGAIALPVWFFKSAQRYGTLNPAVALLEGGELVTWRKQELSAKNVPNPINTAVISDPKHSSIPPLQES